MAQMAVDATFAAFGKAATYKSPPGERVVSVDCTVILNSEDRALNFGSTNAIARGDVIEVRKSELDKPLRDGVFTIAATGEKLTVKSDAKTEDPERLVYSCTVSR